jgi:hypothetical protein
MTLYNQLLRGFVAGDDFDVERTITGIPAGRTLTKAWLTVKRLAADVDGSALLQLVITSSLTSAGQITDTGADGTGTVVFQVSAAQSAALGFALTYQYDIQLKFDNAEIATLERGSLQLEQGVTDATS